MKNLRSMLLLTLVASFMLASCVLSPGPGGYGVEIAPALPPIVVLSVEPYYYQHGYHYYYQNDRWQYSRSRSGPWTELPRSHYPQETRHSGRDRDERGGEFRRQ